MLTSFHRDLEQAIDLADAAVFDILASQSPAVQQLERALRELGRTVAPHYAARMVLTITLVDAVKAQVLPVPIAIYQTDGNRAPKDVTEDTVPQRFLLGEDDLTVPRGVCPQCWSPWSGIKDGTSCDHCGLTLGEDCRVVITGNTCPACGEGSIGVDQPQCPNCDWRYTPATSTFDA